MQSFHWKYREFGLAVAIVAAMIVAVCMMSPAAAQTKVEQERADILKSCDATLKRLYKVRPSAKTLVENAVGYAVFNNFGMKIFLAGGGSGKGIAVYNANKQTIFMRMVEVQVGLGLGVKKFSVVFVFENKDALSDFVNKGWEFSGQATAAAKYEKKGGAYQDAVSVSPGVWMYQLTDKGLALEASGKGTKFYRDEKLN